MYNVFVECLGNSLALAVGSTTVGRGIDCRLRFNDPSVSRRHLRLIRREDDVLLEDLGSANGTLLNGRRVTTAVRVKDGDVIQFGSREMTIHITLDPLDEKSTLLLSKADLLDDEGLPNPAVSVAERTTARFRAPTDPFSRTTQRTMAAVPPPNTRQRCPRCGAAVSDAEDECSNCHYDWGSFRPATPTAVGTSSVPHRRHERHAIELHLRYISSTLEVEATTLDLSEGGVFVCSQVLDPVGTKCSITMLIDGGPPLLVDGIVRRVVEHSDEPGQEIGLGVQFAPLTEEQLEWIRRLTADAT